MWVKNADPLRDHCLDREHNPPSHLVIPQGQSHFHTCPKCGKVTEMTNPITFRVDL